MVMMPGQGKKRLKLRREITHAMRLAGNQMETIASAARYRPSRPGSMDLSPRVGKNGRRPEEG
jgi:hypothetical protein